MAQKSIREYDGKTQLFTYWQETGEAASFVGENSMCAQVKFVKGEKQNWNQVLALNPWLAEKKLVIKPDQLLKRRGELGLVKLNLTFEEAKKWMEENAFREIDVGGVKDDLTVFIVEPFVPHKDHEEYYVSFMNHRDGTLMYFYHQGGVHVGDVDSKATQYVCPIDADFTTKDVFDNLFTNLKEKTPPCSEEDAKAIAEFFVSLKKFYFLNSYAFLEINPFVVSGGKVTVMDCAAKLDSAAHYSCGERWGRGFSFPPPFGKTSLEEEAYIQSLDEKTGSSLKLTILNEKGRIWTMVAGGGASVVYTDSVANYGGSDELANYGEYSGNPNYYLTREYARTIVQLLLRHPHPEGKLLIVGGGIANFTDVAETFRGIIDVFSAQAKELNKNKVKIVVRRGGPNYEQGLEGMRSLSRSHGLDIEVFGIDTHITAPVPHAMKLLKLGNVSEHDTVVLDPTHPALSYVQPGEESHEENEYNLFTKKTQSIVYGIQVKAVQGMLDFDHACGRDRRSVCCMVYPFGENHYRKFYWGSSEVLVPVYDSMDEAIEKHPKASVLVNFASFRSAYEASLDAIRFPQIKTVAVIAEGVPEVQTRQLILACKEKGVRLIGPATVGGIKAGCFKIGNTGGMLNNIISSKLYRPGSVAYVSKSGGMSNELNNIISRNTDGVYEGVAIGGDRYPGTTFIDHIKRYEANPGVKMIVLLGEVGGVDEYEVVELLKKGEIKKPLVAWCIGTCSDSFAFEVSFGHAGSNINAERETSRFKNAALAEAGAFVPQDFDAFGVLISKVHNKLVENDIIKPFEEPAVPVIPMDYSWAAKLGIVRKPTSFITTISDERGDELEYGDFSISRVFKEDLGIGGVIGLLWFQRELPKWAAKFIEMILIITADHGPAVSGAHNTIVTARAGKDLISSLCSGLLTIGPRFGGALDDSAKVFRDAIDRDLTPLNFVKEMRAKKALIPGIGHRVKSVQNPDMRVVLLKEYAKKNFPFKTKMLDYALEVETITTQKKNNLILNVDGTVAVCFIDLVRESGIFQKSEEKTYLDTGVLNGMFVLGRSIGFIGHYLDQTRLKQPLYRHPWNDITRVKIETPKGKRKTAE